MMNTRNDAYQSPSGKSPSRERAQNQDARPASYSSNRVMVENSAPFSKRKGDNQGQTEHRKHRAQVESEGKESQPGQTRSIVEAAEDIGYWGGSSSSLGFEEKRKSSSVAVGAQRERQGSRSSARSSRSSSSGGSSARKQSGVQRARNQIGRSRAFAPKTMTGRKHLYDRDRYVNGRNRGTSFTPNSSTRKSSGVQRVRNQIERNSAFAPKTMTGRRRLNDRVFSSGNRNKGAAFAPRFTTGDLVKRAVIFALIIVAIVFIITRIASCASKAPSQDTSTVAVEQTTAPVVSEELLSQVKAADLSGVLDNDEITAIKNLAQTNADVAWIVANSNQYEQFGSETHAKLFRLILSDSNSISFVRNYIDKVGTEVMGTETLTNRTVPMPFYYQWDTAWAYMTYGDSSLGMNGCGPTCMAMITTAILNDSTINPYTMATLIKDEGYVTEGDGTDADVFPEIATMLGFYGNETYANYDTMKTALERGQYLIVNVGPGDFTRGGHFIVLEKLNANGTVVVHDPYSTVNSSKSWDLESVAGQTKRVFVFE